MSLFNRRTVERRTRTFAYDEFPTWAEVSGGYGVAGLFVDKDRALQHPAVWAAVEMIAATASTLPIDQFRTSGAVRERVPLSPLLADPVGDGTTVETWLHQLFTSAVTGGNAYAEVIEVRNGFPVKARVVNPDCMSWRPSDNVTGWQLYHKNRAVNRWPRGEFIHFPLFVPAGMPFGISPIEYHRRTVASGLAAQKFGNDFFGSDGHPAGLVGVAGDPGPEEARRLKERFRAAARNREVVVMPEGTTYDPLAVSPSDSQFLETMRFVVEEVARIFFGGFPEMIGGSVSGGSITYANREERVRDFLAFAFQPRYLIPFEAVLSSLVPRGQRVRFNLDALLRADLSARYEAYVKAASIGTASGTPLLTPNEMRALEDLPPIDGGDTFVRQRQEPQRDVRGEEFGEVERRNVTHPVPGVELRAEHVTIEHRENVTVMPAPVTIMPLPAPLVNVEPTVVNVEPAVVNVPTPIVNVESAVAPVNVSVETPRKKVRHVRDAAGQIVESIEEPA